MGNSNLRNPEIDGSAFVDIKFRCRIDHFNNRNVIVEFEAELRRDGVTFRAFENTSMGAYELQLRVSNRQGMVYRKTLNFMSKIV